MRYLACFILGFILGACLTNLLLARQQEQLYLSKSALEQHLASAREEIARLKENLAAESYQAIVSIEPVITINGEKISSVEARAATQEISRKVQELLAPLIGQEVRRLNPALIPLMLDNRTVKVDGREFTLKVTLLLVSESVIVHVEAQPSSLSSVSRSDVSLMAGCPATVAI